MLPIPFEDFIPAILKDSLSGDDGGTALVNKIDEHLEDWKDDLIGLAFLKLAERCPDGFLDTLGNMFSAGILGFDTKTQKRAKIYGAIERHKRRGSWSNDAKGMVDAICGGDSSLVTDYFDAQWILWAKESDDPDDYSSTMGEDGIDSDLGLDLIGTFTECVIEGIICIDCDRPMEQTLAPVTYDATSLFTGVNFLRTFSDGTFAILYITAAAVKMTIYDQDGNQVVAPTSLFAFVPTQMGFDILDDDSIVLAYIDTTDGNKLKFNIYDNTITLTDSGTIDTNNCSRCQVTAVDGQYWVVGYYDTISGNGEYAVYQDDSSIATGNFATGNPTSIVLDRYAVDKFIVSYYDSADGNKGKFTVIDTSGSVYTAETVFEANAINSCSVSMIEEESELFGIAYYDTVSAEGKFVYYKKTTLYVSPTVFNSGVVSFIDTFKTDNGNFVILHRQTDLKFIVYSKEGDLFQSLLTFATGALTTCSGVMLQNESFVITPTALAPPGGDFAMYDEGLGATDIKNLVESFAEDIAPAYFKVQFVYYDQETDFLTIYPNGTIG